MVTGTVYVDLTTRRETARNLVYFALAATPNNAKVLVNVGDLLPALALDAFHFLLEQMHRVHIEVQGGAEAVKHWYHALTAGAPTLDVAV
jgi:hypothetical protein